MLYIKAMKKWRETTGHTLDIGVWSVEIESYIGVQAKDETNWLRLLTMPAPFTAPNNRMFSDISLTVF